MRFLNRIAHKIAAESDVKHDLEWLLRSVDTALSHQTAMDKGQFSGSLRSDLENIKRQVQKIIERAN
jgi:hypothetical protein